MLGSANHVRKVNPMRTDIDTFGVGLLLGLLVSAPFLISRELAIGMLTTVAASCCGFTLLNGVAAFGKALASFMTSVFAHPTFAMGFFTGFAILAVTIRLVHKF